MVAMLWTACSVAQIALMLRICTSRGLLRHWWPIAAWMLVDLSASLRLTLSDYERHSWPWALQWATWIWPVLAVQVLAAGGVIVNLVRQYGRANRRVLALVVGILLAASFLVSGTLSYIVETLALPDVPTGVEHALAWQRTIALALSVLLLSAIATMTVRPLPLSPNLRWIPVCLAAYWLGVAIRVYALVAWERFGVPGFDAGNAPMLISIAVFGLLAWRLRESDDWDVRDVRPSETARQAASYLWRERVRRLLRGRRERALIEA